MCSVNYTSLNNTFFSESNYFEKLFKTVKFTIKITKSPQSSETNYIFSGIDIAEYSSSKCNNDVDKLADSLCDKINNKRKFYKGNWTIFYLYKEIIQCVAEPEKPFQHDGNKINFNYFRGQTFGYSLCPTIFRNNYNDKEKKIAVSPLLLKNFDIVYKSICEKYPDDISYVPYNYSNKDSMILRCSQIAKLQHYGFKSALIDLTKNPYIALLFMISDSDDVFEKNYEDFCIKPFRLEMFSIDEYKQAKDVFYTVNKDARNKRITAQQGAFINCEVLHDVGDLQSIGIPRFIFELELVSDFDKKLKEQQEKKNEFIEKISSLLEDISRQIKIIIKKLENPTYLGNDESSDTDFTELEKTKNELSEKFISILKKFLEQFKKYTKDSKQFVISDIESLVDRLSESLNILSISKIITLKGIENSDQFPILINKINDGDFKEPNKIIKDLGLENEVEVKHFSELSNSLKSVKEYIFLLSKVNEWIENSDVHESEFEFNNDDKKDVLSFINEQIKNKLEEFRYYKQDLFPDFYDRLEYLNRIYSDIPKKVAD